MSCRTKVLLEQGCMCLCTQRLCFFFLFYTKKLQSCEVIGNSVLFVHSGLWRGLIQLMICNVRKRIRAHLTERKLGDWHLKLSGKLGLLRDCGGFLRYSYLWVGGSMWDLSLSLSLSLSLIVCSIMMTLHFHSSPGCKFCLFFWSFFWQKLLFSGCFIR